MVDFVMILSISFTNVILSPTCMYTETNRKYVANNFFIHIHASELLSSIFFYMLKMDSKTNVYLPSLTGKHVLHSIISRPRQSQGLLYKHRCDSLKVSNPSFSCNGVTAPQRPSGSKWLFQS